MATIRERFDSWRKRPTREQLAATVADLQTKLESNRFKRYNPVPSGVPITYNQYQYEQNQKLRGSGRWDIYHQLANDPHTLGALRSITLPLVNADWEIQAASDDARDVEIAEFVSANLLRKGGEMFGPEYYLQTPWKAVRLREILDMLESGFSMFAKSTKIVNGKRIYDRIQWLEPSSVDPLRGWHLDGEDNLEYVERTYSDAQDRYRFYEPLQAEQIMLYVWELKGARFEGIPLTRAMYGAWTRKEFKLKMSAILAQKLGAPVPYGFWPRGFPADAIPAFKQFVESLRGTAAAEAYFAGPMGDDNKPPEFGYAGADHNVDRGFSEIIDQENREIGHAGGNSSANLGETETGSRALGESKGMVEMVMVEAVAELICEIETHGTANLPGTIQELVDWNYSNVREYPRLAVNKINPFAIASNWEQLVNAWTAGIVPKTPEARRQIIETHLGLNLPDEQYEVEDAVPGFPDDVEPDFPTGESTPDDADDAEESGDDQMSMEAAAYRSRIAALLEPMEDAPTGGRFRARTRLEVEVVNLASVHESLSTGERDCLTVLRSGHRGMIDDLMGRLSAGKINPRNIESQRASKYRGRKQLQRDLLEVFGEVGEAGWDAVRGEVEAQDAS